MLINPIVGVYMPIRNFLSGVGWPSTIEGVDRPLDPSAFGSMMDAIFVRFNLSLAPFPTTAADLFQLSIGPSHGN